MLPRNNRTPLFKRRFVISVISRRHKLYLNKRRRRRKNEGKERRKGEREEGRRKARRDVG